MELDIVSTSIVLTMSTYVSYYVAYYIAYHVLNFFRRPCNDAAGRSALISLKIAAFAPTTAAPRAASGTSEAPPAVPGCWIQPMNLSC